MLVAAGAQTDSQTLPGLQGSTGGPLGAAGGQQGGITLPSSCRLRTPHTSFPGQADAASQYSRVLQCHVLLSSSRGVCLI